MRIYFITAERAALKLDGEYAGITDLFERHAECDLSRPTAVEIIPDDDLRPLNFFIDEKFFSQSHPFAAVAVSDYAACIYVDGFEDKSDGIEVLAQGYAGGGLVTLFRQGRIYAAYDGAACAMHPLPRAFFGAHISNISAAGQELALIETDRYRAVLYGGELVFCGEAERIEGGEELTVYAPLHGCCDALAKISYAFDGKFYESGRSVTLRRSPQAGTEHIAMLECVLSGADPSPFLTDELQKSAGALRDYLGEFVAVVPPCNEAVKVLGERAAGLVYRRQGRLYDVKYFICETEGGKVANIYPAEEREANSAIDLESGG